MRWRYRGKAKVGATAPGADQAEQFDDVEWLRENIRLWKEQSEAMGRELAPDLIDE